MHPAQYSNFMRELTYKLEQNDAQSKDQLMEQLENSKQVCFTKSNSAKEYVKCLKPIIEQSLSKQRDVRLKNVFLELLMIQCMKKAEDNHVQKCLLQVNKVVDQELNKYKQNEQKQKKKQSVVN